MGSLQSVSTETPLRSETKQSNRIAKKLDIGEIAGAVSGIGAIILLMGGFLGAIGTFSGATYGWAILGGSIGITALSRGYFAPATIVTSVLAILSLAGTLPFTAMGLGVTITMSIALVGTMCLVEAC